jgi:hypothetical protein
MKNLRVFCLLVLLVLVLMSCGGSSINDALDIVQDPERKPIDKSITGMNAFAADARFGTPAQQFADVKSELGLSYVRLLFAWNDGVQGTPGAEPNFSFYDDLVAALPAGLEGLVVLTDVPSWMSNSANWIDGDPRKTFAELWVRKVAERYASSASLVGFQIWNEPNDPSNPDNTLLGFIDNAGNYVSMLSFAHAASKQVAPSKLVLNAATTAINQNFPLTVDYNRAMRDAGAENYTDRWAVHYYGRQFENISRGGGVADFLNGLSMGVWVTESGAQGVNNQLAYVEQVWPYLREKVPSIERFYYYQYAEPTDPLTSYGLRTLQPNFPVSDLYIYLRN